jgi:hypothetical protein
MDYDHFPIQIAMCICGYPLFLDKPIAMNPTGMFKGDTDLASCSGAAFATASHLQRIRCKPRGGVTRNELGHGVY